MLCNLRKVIDTGESPYRRDIIRVYRIIIYAGKCDALYPCQISAEENKKNSRQALSVVAKIVFYLGCHPVSLTLIIFVEEIGYNNVLCNMAIIPQPLWGSKLLQEKVPGRLWETL